MRRNGNFNPKRKIDPNTEEKLQLGARLAQKVQYGGNPEHKKNQGDFGLHPPANPRSTKSLCDDVNIFNRKMALAYLKKGLELGLMRYTKEENGEWPQNVWAVTDDGKALEAQLENSDTGTYHGYPMPTSDPLAAEVIKEWKKRNGKV